MDNISLPACGLPVGRAGLPCKRWPGHLGPCIDQHGNSVLDTHDMMVFKPPDVDMLFRRLMYAGIIFWVLMSFCTATCVYLLVRLPCHLSPFA